MGKVTPEEAKWRSYHTSPWRKSRICARLYLRPELVKRDRYRNLAARLLRDPEVTNRLIDQAVASLKGAAYQKSLGR
jgi:hypothetical protein